MKKSTTIKWTEGDDEKCIKINHKIAVNKWNPVMDMLNIPNKKYINENRIFSDIDPYGEENWDENSEYEIDPFRIFMSVYAEYYLKFIDLIEDNSLYYFNEDIFPMNLRILSDLDIRNKKYEIRKGLDTKEVVIFFSKEEYSELENLGMDDKLIIVNDLMITLIDQINEEIETKEIIYIDQIISEILALEENNKVKLILRTKYQIE